MKKQNILKDLYYLVDSEKEEILDFVRKFLQIPSEIGNEFEAQNFLFKYFKNIDLDVDMFLPTEVEGIQNHPGWWPGDVYDNRPNVVAVWKGIKKNKSLIINGHIDTVEAGPLGLWNYPPFDATIKGGCIFARGAVDMKGALGAIIALIGLLKRNCYKINGDLIIESVVGEELGWFNGSLSCILRGYNADAVLIPEPTDLRIALGTKGNEVYRLKVPGEGAHQMVWWKGVSALDNLIKIKSILAKFQEIRSNEHSNHSLYGFSKGFPIPVLCDDIYYLTVGSPNLMAVPTEAIAHFMVDVLPGENREDVLNRFETFVKKESMKIPYLKENNIELERLPYRPIYPTSVPDNLEVVTVLKNGYENVMKLPVTKFGFEGSCDAMTFNLYSSTPAVIFGPGKIEQAHKPNEFININELMNYIKIIAYTIFYLFDLEKT